MQKFKRKSLYLALISAVTSVGIANTASAAVHINGNGLGEVLIYPYYTTRAGNDTYLSVVNTTGSAKAVKVRFTEGKNSREVLDFNLYLSKYDMWTAAVVNTANGAKVVTFDESCTNPRVVPGPVGEGFKNSAYSGTLIEGITDFGLDGAGTTLDRTREGYFEIIEMGTITNTAIEAAITHVSGRPANCSVVQSSIDMGFASTDVYPAGSAFSAKAGRPTGGLAGTASLVNVASGTDFTFEPVVIDDFARTDRDNIWFAGGSIEPDLRSADNHSITFDGISPLASTWGSAKEDRMDAVSAVLMHDKIINEYVLDAATLSGTDWVITLPTKRYYVPVDDPTVNALNPESVFPPFTHSFWANGACEPVKLKYYDREEGTVNNIGFSPPSQDGGTSLCWETNALTFKGSNVLGSGNSVNVDVEFQNGWLAMTFDTELAVQRLVDTNGNTYHGLPTVGFMVQDFINLNVTPNVMSSYGGNFAHKYTVKVTPGVL